MRSTSRWGYGTRESHCAGRRGAASGEGEGAGRVADADYINFRPNGSIVNRRHSAKSHGLPEETDCSFGEGALVPDKGARGGWGMKEIRMKHPAVVRILLLASSLLTAASSMASDIGPNTPDETINTFGTVEVPWVEQGPGPIPGDGVLASGAINAIAADPTNANRVFVAAVNGGIWGTQNATDTNPTWTPLTDHKESLSMRGIVFDPLDTSHNTLFGTLGLTSHAFFLNSQTGNPLIGILKTIDGGSTWSLMPNTGFNGASQILRFLPTTLQTSTGQVLLAATLAAGFIDGQRNVRQCSPQIVKESLLLADLRGQSPRRGCINELRNLAC